MAVRLVGGLGGVVSTVHEALDGVGSRLPAGSVAATWKLCDPSTSPVYEAGLVQTAKAEPSSEHWKVELFSVAWKARVAAVLFESVGGT